MAMIKNLCRLAFARPKQAIPRAWIAVALCGPSTTTSLRSSKATLRALLVIGLLARSDVVAIAKPEDVYGSAPRCGLRAGCAGHRDAPRPYGHIAPATVGVDIGSRLDVRTQEFILVGVGLLITGAFGIAGSMVAAASEGRHDRNQAGAWGAAAPDRAASSWRGLTNRSRRQHRWAWSPAWRPFLRNSGTRASGMRYQHA
jgi:hypothetical protein